MGMQARCTRPSPTPLYCPLGEQVPARVAAQSGGGDEAVRGGGGAAGHPAAAQGHAADEGRG